MNANASVAIVANHIPSALNNAGRRNTKIVWKTRARRNESIAETSPLLSAVKNPDEKILMPENTNTNEYILKA